MVYFIYIYIALYIYLSFIQVHELCQKKKNVSASGFNLKD